MDTVMLSQSFSKYPALKRVLSNRLLSDEKKAEVIAMVSGDNVSSEFKTFVRLLLAERREEFLQIICLDYQQLLREHKNVLDVSVTTAAAIDDDTQKQMTQMLEQMTGKKVTLQTTVDSSIVGGYILRWDTYRIDSSVKASLKRIEKKLTEIARV